MQKRFLAALVLLTPLLAGCVSFDDDDIPVSALPREAGRNLVENTGQKPLQCVPYARDHSGVKIFGDAYTWWDKAADKYQRSPTPQSGAVMVLSGYAGTD